MKSIYLSIFASNIYTYNLFNYLLARSDMETSYSNDDTQSLLAAINLGKGSSKQNSKYYKGVIPLTGMIADELVSFFFFYKLQYLLL